MFREGRGGRHGSVDLRDAIARSCDVYFYDLANTLGVDQHRLVPRAVRLRQPTGIDIGGEKRACCPRASGSRARSRGPQDQVWFPGETVNFGIGQGYMLVTPLQLAHYTSMLANRGKSFKPRLVTALRDPLTGKVERVAPDPQRRRDQDGTPEQWQIVMKAWPARCAAAARPPPPPART